MRAFMYGTRHHYRNITHRLEGVEGVRVAAQGGVDEPRVVEVAEKVRAAQARAPGVHLVDGAVVEEETGMVVCEIVLGGQVGVVVGVCMDACINV